MLYFYINKKPSRTTWFFVYVKSVYAAGTGTPGIGTDPP